MVREWLRQHQEQTCMLGDVWSDATLLLEAGVPLKTVSERLGHSSTHITADIYGHVTEKMAREAVIALDWVFSNSPDKKIWRIFDGSKINGLPG